MSIAIGCDEAAFEMKETIKAYVQELGHEVEDYGVYDTSPVLYPDIAVKVAQAVAEGKHERGILICGTGIGMAIAANKVPGIRAAQCHDPFSAERSRKSNNAQIMTMGARIIGIELAKSLVHTWLDSEFQGGRSIPKVDKINEYDQKFRQ
ncbi:ribose 5-phosphate isomerase B [candidate division KSB3 bacterium]|uniref:Ribose 5-phosphate isomerase B n=1 Tax=candidate division KSB3 bacterium TaxID=2044937 RepID=A0A9D5Q5W2_9BACT|nr:ribose 5-phosphate isomerase B [candidate division KSB3 bacterium]MBD3324271.1 ribose 5-phosphate isomerase B [candidate division KSB3 bacterium]